MSVSPDGVPELKAMHCLSSAKQTNLIDWQQVVALQDTIRNALSHAELEGKIRAADGFRDALGVLECALRHDISVHLVESLHPLLVSACRRAYNDLIRHTSSNERHRIEWISARFSLSETLCDLTSQVETTGDPVARELRRRWGTLGIDARLAGLDELIAICNEVERAWASLSADHKLKDILPLLKSSAIQVKDYCRKMYPTTLEARADDVHATADVDYSPSTTCSELFRIKRRSSSPGKPKAVHDRELIRTFTVAAKSYLQDVYDILETRSIEMKKDDLRTLHRSYLALSGLAGFVQLRSERTLACAAVCLVEKAQTDEATSMDKETHLHLKRVTEFLTLLVECLENDEPVGDSVMSNIIAQLRTIRHRFVIRQRQTDR